MRLFLIILAIAYAISPWDLLPDWLVGFGWLDDIGILGLLWWYLYRYSKRRTRWQGPSARGRDEYSRYQSRGQNTGNFTKKDPYQTLGVDRKASQADIRLAYKKLVSKYHPDKVSHLGKEFQTLAEKRFREIQEAYDKLKVR